MYTIRIIDHVNEYSYLACFTYNSLEDAEAAVQVMHDSVADKNMVDFNQNSCHLTKNNC